MDVKTEEIDFARAAQLLDVVHQCAGVGPKLTSLGNAAMTELTKMNDTIKVAAQEAEKERLQKNAEEQTKRKAVDDESAAATERNNQRLRDAADAQRADQLRQTNIGNPALDPEGNPTESEPDENLKGQIKPTVFPADSKTATIADNNIRRV